MRRPMSTYRHHIEDATTGRSESAKRYERDMTYLREKCMSGVPMQRMTIAELHKAVRELVPANVTTFVELTVKKYSHRPHEEPEVEVSIWAAINHGPHTRWEAPTAYEVLRDFSTKGLRELGLTEPAPALERLAAMDAPQ